MAEFTKLVHLETGADGTTATDIVVEELGGDRFAVTIGAERIEVEGFTTDRGVSFRLGDRVFDVPVEQRGDLHITAGAVGRRQFELVDERTYKIRTALGAGVGVVKPEVVSPMTGKVVLVRCSAGDTVKTGDTLVVIEAMKMENEVKAPADVVVRAIRVSAGDLVSPGDVLVELEVE